MTDHFLATVTALGTATAAVVAGVAVFVSAKYQRKTIGAQLLADYDQRLYTEKRRPRCLAAHEMRAAYEAGKHVNDKTCPTVQDVLDFLYMVGYFVYEERIISKPAAIYSFGYWAEHYYAAAKPWFDELRAKGSDAWDAVEWLAADSRRDRGKVALPTQRDIEDFLQDEIAATRD